MSRSRGLPSILPGLCALAIAAGLLIVTAALVSAWQLPDGAGRAAAVAIPGRALSPVLGEAVVRGDALAVLGYAPFEDEFHAIAVTRGRYVAADYPVLRLSYTTGHPGPRLDLVWRNSLDPTQGRSMPLNRSADGESLTRLAQHPDWRGNILEIGVYLAGDERRREVLIERLVLEPHDWRTALATHWSVWTAFRGWTLRSINFLRGAQGGDTPSPVPVAAAWAGLALALLAGLRLAGIAIAPVAVVATGLLPWVALDVLWQNELAAQLRQTQARFGGLTAEQRHLVDEDRRVYAHIRRLRESILPEEPARILVLQDTAANPYNRLKSQYYLLPHNVYNFGGVPPDHGLRHFDYVLALGELPELEIRDGLLTWNSLALPVELLDEDPSGDLYRVTGWVKRGWRGRG